MMEKILHSNFAQMTVLLIFPREKTYSFANIFKRFASILKVVERRKKEIERERERERERLQVRVCKKEREYVRGQHNSNDTPNFIAKIIILMASHFLAVTYSFFWINNFVQMSTPF